MSVSTEQRNAAIELSRSRPAEALKTAIGIEEAWFRVQALASVARYAGADIARNAFAAAALSSSEGKDPYQRAAVLAWPMRAALEVGDQNRAEMLIAEARRELPRIELHCSRAEAYAVVFQAAFIAPRLFWGPLLDDLVRFCPPDAHWRSERLYRTVAAILRQWDGATARTFIDRIPAGRARTRCERDDSNGVKMPPRSFFW